MPPKELIPLLLPKVPGTQEENIQALKELHIFIFFFLKTKMSFTV